MTATAKAEPDTRPRASLETTEEDRREFLTTALAVHNYPDSTGKQHSCRRGSDDKR
jgi:hypothetical protein